MSKADTIDITHLPDTPGVYFFKAGNRVLYVGKATSLRDRVRSYFGKDLLERRGPKLVKMMELAEQVDFEATDSVLEALILEAKYIKKLQPEFNTRDKDGKSYNYVVITEEPFPRVFTLRQREIERSPEIADGSGIRELFGPFPHGGQLRIALRLIRKIFPFRDKKANQKHHERFYRQLGLAPDTADSEAALAYARTIRHITLFLRGEKKRLVKSIEMDMRALAKELKFEEANELKKTLFALQHIRDVALIKDDLVDRGGRVTRIEAYDVAHMSGKNTVGVMTVVTDGERDQAQYRKFKVKSDRAGSDTHALAEILERRLGHTEWRYPSLIVIDGGLAQKRVAERVLREAGVMIPIVSVVKDERHRPKNILGQGKIIRDLEADILLANAEAHRFAIEYHKYLRRKGLVGK